MQICTTRLFKHVNGKVQYSRQLYFRPGLSLTDIREADPFSYLTSNTMLLSDLNTCYFANTNNVLYRTDSTKLSDMEVPTTSETLNARLERVTRDYNRIYLRDSISSQQVIGYKDRNTSELVNTYRSSYKPTTKLDPSETYDAGLTPVNIVFSPLLSWDLMFYNESLTSHVVADALLSEFTMGSTSEFKVVCRLSDNTITSIAYSEKTGVPHGTIPVYKLQYSDHQMTDGDLFPTSITLQLYERDLQNSSLMNLRFNATTVQFAVSDIKFDTDETSQKLTLSDFAGTKMADYRFDWKNPLYYSYQKDLSDQQILSSKYKIDQARKMARVRKYFWYLLIMLIPAGIAVAWYRARRYD